MKQRGVVGYRRAVDRQITSEGAPDRAKSVRNGRAGLPGSARAIPRHDRAADSGRPHGRGTAASAGDHFVTAFFAGDLHGRRSSSDGVSPPRFWQASPDPSARARMPPFGRHIPSRYAWRHAAALAKGTVSGPACAVSCRSIAMSATKGAVIGRVQGCAGRRGRSRARSVPPSHRGCRGF